MFKHRTEKLATGRTYHFVDQLPVHYDPETTLTLLCVHGFPDLWYGWRYQIGPWTANGFRVVVPDMLGYGGTDKPTEISEYSTKKLSDDLAALLNLLGIRKAVLVGHDWGSYVAGRFALWYPDRLLALIMLSIPFVPPSIEYIPVEELARRLPNLRYQAYFADSKSTHDLDTNLSLFLNTAYAAPNAVENVFATVPDVTQLDGDFPTVLNDMEMEYYYSQLSKGMQGPLSYYRTGKVRFEEEKAANLPSTLRADLPVLCLWGTADPASTLAQIFRAQKFIPRLEIVSLEGAGHWLMVECKQLVVDKVVDWLNTTVHAKSSL